MQQITTINNFSINSSTDYFLFPNQIPFLQQCSKVFKTDKNIFWGFNIITEESMVKWAWVHFIAPKTITSLELSDFFLRIIPESLKNNLDPSEYKEIGYLLSNIDQNEITKELRKILNGKWETYLNYAENMQNEIPINVFHFYYYNPEFSGQLPKVLINKMQSALAFDIAWKEFDENALSQLGLDLKNSIVQLIIKKRKELDNLWLRVSKELKKVKKARKKSYFLPYFFQSTKLFPKLFQRALESDFKILHKAKIQLKYISKLSRRQWDERKMELIPALYQILFDCIISEGSSYYLFFTDEGKFNNEIFSDEFINKYFGMDKVLIEMKVKDQVALLGLAFTHKKRNSPLTFRNGILIRKECRNFGLGQMVAKMGMLYGEINLDYQKFEVMNTTRNFSTNKIVERAGFFDYGYIKDQTFSITGFLKNPTIGVRRTMSFSSDLLEKLIANSREPIQIIKWKKALKINNLLKSSFQSKLQAV